MRENKELLVGEGITLIDHTFKEGEEKNKQWYENRKGTIGGSDIGSLFGENKYKSVLQLFNEKSGRVESEMVHNAATLLGSSMESTILNLYEYYNGDSKAMYSNFGTKSNRIREVFTYNGYIRNSNFPYIQVELDGFFVDDNGELVIVECKTMNGMAFKYNNEEPPIKYLLQVMTCMAVTGATSAVILMLIDGVNYHVFEVSRSEGVIEEIKDKVLTFWNNVNMYKETESSEYVPEVDATSSCEKALNNLYPKANKDKVREATDEERILIGQYAVMNEDYKQLEEDLRAIRNKLKEGIKDGYKVTSEGYSASWSNFGKGRRFQVKRLTQ